MSIIVAIVMGALAVVSKMADWPTWTFNVSCGLSIISFIWFLARRGMLGDTLADILPSIDFGGGGGGNDSNDDSFFDSWDSDD